MSSSNSSGSTHSDFTSFFKFKINKSGYYLVSNSEL